MNEVFSANFVIAWTESPHKSDDNDDDDDGGNNDDYDNSSNWCVYYVLIWLKIDLELHVIEI